MDESNFEKEGIPFNEIAKICAMKDMTELELQKRTEEAINVFTNIKEFFQNDAKQFYLTTIISENDMDSILLELEEIFVRNEDYEKCAEIKKWNQKITETRKHNT